MGLFSDGGIFATKPYICASSYLLKMSDFKRGAWCDMLDGLYKQFTYIFDKEYNEFNKTLDDKIKSITSRLFSDTKNIDIVVKPYIEKLEIIPRIIKIKLGVQELKTLTLNLSTVLSQPVQENWDKIFNSNILSTLKVA
jgi:hypothetical protein